MISGLQNDTIDIVNMLKLLNFFKKVFFLLKMPLMIGIGAELQ